MSDENSNSTGIVQTGVQPQQNQQPDDFVLDFGDNEETELNKEFSLEKSDEEGDQSETIQEDGTAMEEKINTIEDKELDNKGEKTEEKDSPADDFSISFDDSPVEEIVEDNEETVEDNEETVEDNEETVEDNEETVEDNEETVEDNEETVEDDEETVEDNEEAVEDNEETVEDNEETVEDNEEIVEDNEETVEDNEEIVEDNEETVEDNEEAVEDSDVSAETKNKDDIFGDSDLFDRDDASTQESVEDNGETVEDNEEIVEDDEETVEDDEETVEDNEEAVEDSDVSAETKNEDDIFGDSDLFDGNGTVTQNVVAETELNNVEDNGIEQTNVQETNVQELNSINNVEENINNSDSTPVKQPEIGDLLGNSTVNFSSENVSNDVIQTGESGQNNINGAENEVDTTLGNEITTETVDNNITSQSTSPQINEVSQNISYDLSDISNTTTVNNPENINNVIPQAQNLMEQATVVNEVNLGAVVNNEIPVNTQNVVPENNVPAVGNTIELKPTLSLDEILDSELNNNPQFANNSKAVPTNVPLSHGLFGNKTTLFLAGIGIFVIIGLVAVFGLPSNNAGSNTGNNTDIEAYTGDNTDNPGHQSADDFELGTGEQTETGDINTLDHNSGTGGAKTTDIVIFPDAGDDENEDENNDENNDGNGDDEILPYIGDVIEDPTDEISLEEIQTKISAFKLQGEKYYEQGDETQDRQLVRLSLQLISCCDEYQTKVSAGEGLNEEDFSGFKEKANGLIKTIDNYLNPDDVEEFRQTNFNDEYGWDDKDKVKDHIYRTR